MSFKTSEQTDKLYPALIEARANMPIILKDGKAHHGKYVSVTEIIRAAYPWLAHYKLAVITATTWQPILEGESRRAIAMPTAQDGQTFVTCRIMHESTQFIEGSIPVLLVPLEKDTIQALGGRISYLVRYMLRDMLGIHNAELDDDGDYEAAPLPKKEQIYYINEEQIEQLEHMMADHPEMKEKFLNFYKIKTLALLPNTKFWECHDAIRKIQERYKQSV